jgi:hypothetical protein
VHVRKRIDSRNRGSRPTRVPSGALSPACFSIEGLRFAPWCAARTTGRRRYELTGPRSQDLDGVAGEFSDALNREVAYSDISPEEWERELKRQGVPEHLMGHLLTIGELHRAGRYDRLADGVERVTGRPAMSVREFVSLYTAEFGGRRP